MNICKRKSKGVFLLPTQRGEEKYLTPDEVYLTKMLHLESWELIMRVGDYFYNSTIYHHKVASYYFELQMH